MFSLTDKAAQLHISDQDEVGTDGECQIHLQELNTVVERRFQQTFCPGMSMSGDLQCNAKYGEL